MYNSYFFSLSSAVPADVFHGVFKEHEVHGSIEFVVSGEGVTKDGSQVVPASHGEVPRFPNAPSEMAEHIRLGCDLGLLELLHRYQKRDKILNIYKQLHTLFEFSN